MGPPVILITSVILPAVLSIDKHVNQGITSELDHQEGSVYAKENWTRQSAS